MSFLYLRNTNYPTPVIRSYPERCISKHVLVQSREQVFLLKKDSLEMLWHMRSSCYTYIRSFWLPYLCYGIKFLKTEMSFLCFSPRERLPISYKGNRFMLLFFESVWYNIQKYFSIIWSHGKCQECFIFHHFFLNICLMRFLLFLVNWKSALQGLLWKDDKRVTTSPFVQNDGCGSPLGVAQLRRWKDGQTESCWILEIKMQSAACHACLHWHLRVLVVGVWEGA